VERAAKFSDGAWGTALPFGYRPGDSPLHRCPALVKLLAVLLLSALAYGSLPALGIAALGIGGAAAAAGMGPRELLRGSRPLWFLALFFFFLRVSGFQRAAPFFYLDPEEIPGGLLQSLSMIVSFAGGSLLFAVTTMKELRGSLEGCGRPGRRFGLALSLMLGFLPLFFEIWEETCLAWEARGGGRGIRRFLLVIPPVTERMIEKALDTARALEARGLEL
jgi:biotin transport system permease protein